MKKILFGAGLYGKIALKKYGDDVAYFVDNNADLQGKRIDGVEVISLNRLMQIYDKYEIIITTKYKDEIIKILNERGITNYKCYSVEDKRYYPTDELVINPYETISNQYLDQTQQGIQQKIEVINKQVNELYFQNNLFNHVEIETINRCNGTCSFCPVSKENDTRVMKKMTWELFEKIINQLSAINYDGRISLFSNNEPFLDDTIIEKHKYAREKLPLARMHLFTNGTLLNIEKFSQIIQYLDELVIDNYQQDLQLIKPCKEIQYYCEEHPELKKKVTIVLRKRDEILSNRGGDAPNREDTVSYPDAKCVLPFKQLIIRPDGKVSLCCNDPLGRNTLADLTQESILEAWNNERFKMVRKCLYEGRKEWKHCEFCDVFNLG